MYLNTAQLCNIDINIDNTHDGNLIANMHMNFCYFTIFKDYVTGLEVLARLLYYLFQGRVAVCYILHSLY